ncbi:MAG: magnesium transporter CorA family protein [Patescibacteria group bacterium]|jgi:magnesium transporter
MPQPKHIHLLRENNYQWVNATQNTLCEINWLKKNFDFDPLDLKDCLPPNNRPKLLERRDYLFLTLLFPIYNRPTREIKAVEVDFFIGQNFLVTCHDSQLPPLRDFFALCQKDTEMFAHLLSGGPAALLYELLNRLTEYCFPMLAHLNNDVNQIESQIFTAPGPKLIREIALIKKNIVNFRQAMQTHKNLIYRLMEAGDRLLPGQKLELRFKNLVEQSKEIWDTLENCQNTVNALYETHASLASYQLSQIIKTLTIISVIFMPINLLAFIFGMNTVYHPLVGQPADFWLIIALMAVVAGVLILIFKKKRWW